MVLLYDEHLGDTIISRNTDISGNIIVEIRDLVLPSIHMGLHTGDAKYRIYSSKIETVTNVIFTKLLKEVNLITFWRLLMIK